MYRHSLVRSLVRHYAEAAGLEKMPRVFTSPTSFEKYMVRRGGLTRREKGHLRKGYALSVGRVTNGGEVYFNMARHETMADLRDTAAHEVLHLRNPSLSHGNEFDARVQWLLDGNRFGAKGTRLPATFR